MGKFVFNDKNYSGEPNPINDSIISANTTWSSDKINNNKMDKANPTGTGSLSLNRKANTTIGTNSVAEGYDTTASGVQSHAEGGGTTASADQAHSEGGGTTASGVCAHAEGSLTTASGGQAHAEGGGTTASGAQSHAEGAGTTASGVQAHAEGTYTIAAGDSQHVSGRYNIEDNYDRYAEIVGNGTSFVRSNARTLDWSGNESLAGNIDAAGFGSRLAALLPSDLSDLSDVDLTNLQNGMTLKYNSGTLKFEAGVLYIEILQADYDQLTYDQKHNGIPYFITDGHGAAALPSYVDLTDILLAGNTTLTIQSPYITTAGTYDIYTDPEVPYISKVVTTGQIVITFDEQSSDLAVKVRIT